MNNKMLFFVINTIVFLLVLIFVYRFVFSNCIYEYKNSKSTYLTLKNANYDLGSFDKMKQNIEDQQPVYQEIFDKYRDSFVTNDELIHDYENKVEESFKSNDIPKFEKAVQYILDDNEMKNISLELSLNAGYDNIYFALFDIEKYSVISRFLMLSNNDIKMECRPILHDADLDEFFMGRVGYAATEKTLSKDDFKKVYDRLIKLSDIEIPTWKDLLPVPKNPFVMVLTPEEKAKLSKLQAKPKQTPAKIRDIYIEGILFEKNAPVCVIKGKVYRTDSVYDGDVKIIRILKNGIIVRYKGYNYPIKTNYK